MKARSGANISLIRPLFHELYMPKNAWHFYTLLLVTMRLSTAHVMHRITIWMHVHHLGGATNLLVTNCNNIHFIASYNTNTPQFPCDAYNKAYTFKLYVNFDISAIYGARSNHPGDFTFCYCMVITGCPVTISNFSTRIQIHTHPLQCPCDRS